MTAFGVIPKPDCDLCGDSGWATIIGGDGDAYSILCPECDAVPGEDVDAGEHLEVPF